MAAERRTRVVIDVISNEADLFREAQILDRLQHSFGRDFIVKISFRVG